MEQNRKKFDELRLIASPQGFAVYDSGRNKLSIHALDLFIRPGMSPMMQIALPSGSIDAVGTPLFAVVDVATGKPRVVKRIEWADGEATDFPVSEEAKAVFNEKMKVGAASTVQGKNPPPVYNSPPPGE